MDSETVHVCVCVWKDTSGNLSITLDRDHT